MLKGSFDQFAEAATGKRGTTEVDDAFLTDIEHWRELLVRDLALATPLPASVTSTLPSK